MKTLVIALIVTFFTSNCFANQVKESTNSSDNKPVSKRSNIVLHYGRLYVGDDFYIVTVVKSEGMDKMSIYDNQNKELLSFSSDSVGNSFRTVELKYVEAYGDVVIITTWSKGAHGSMIRVFDLKKPEPLVLERSSSWSTDYYISDGESLNIVQKGDMNDDTVIPKDYNLKWP
jgi:hypothetical protein